MAPLLAGQGQRPMQQARSLSSWLRSGRLERLVEFSKAVHRLPTTRHWSVAQSGDSVQSSEVIPGFFMPQKKGLGLVY